MHFGVQVVQVFEDGVLLHFIKLDLVFGRLSFEYFQLIEEIHVQKSGVAGLLVIFCFGLHNPLLVPRRSATPLQLRPRKYPRLPLLRSCPSDLGFHYGLLLRDPIIGVAAIAETACGWGWDHAWDDAARAIRIVKQELIRGNEIGGNGCAELGQGCVAGAHG